MKVDKNLCVGCGCCCNGICPVAAIQLKEGKAEIDQSKCVNCGTCKGMCCMGAISE